MNDLLERPRADTTSIRGGGLESIAGGDPSPMSQPPVATLAELRGRLEALQSWIEEHATRRQHDGIACFNCLCRDITERLAECVDEGSFEDPAFVIALYLASANRYLDALRAYEADPRRAPGAWDALFERRDQRGIGPVQFSVAGLNAFVNFDLPQAVVATCAGLGRSLDRGARPSDYDRLNQVFAEEAQALREHFDSRFERWIDEHVLTQIGHAFGNWSADAARDTAWASAAVLWSLRGREDSVRSFVDSLDRLVGLAGRGVLAHR